MKHLLSFAALVTSSLVCSGALAESPACGSAGSVTYEPLYGRSNVPRDARLPFSWAACRTLSLDLQDQNGTPIPFTRPPPQGSVHTVQPIQPLAANLLHRIVVTDGNETAVIPFTTGGELLQRTEVAVPVIESAESRRLESDPSLTVFTVTVSEKGAAPLGVLIVREGGDETVAKVSTGERMQFFHHGKPAPGETTCFTALYEDPSGTRSAASAPTCVTEPDDGGCSFAPARSKASAGGIALFAAIGLVAVRRRRVR